MGEDFKKKVHALKGWANHIVVKDTNNFPKSCHKSRYTSWNKKSKWVMGMKPGSRWCFLLISGYHSSNDKGGVDKAQGNFSQGKSIIWG